MDGREAREDGRVSVHVSEIHHCPHLCLARNRYLMYLLMTAVCMYFFSPLCFLNLH